jgi:hypothetical protein
VDSFDDCSDAAITFVVSATDPSGVTNVAVNLHGQNIADDFTVGMLQSTQNPSRYSATIPGTRFKGAGRYTFTFTARDGRGNVATTTTGGFFDVEECGESGVE